MTTTGRAIAERTLPFTLTPMRALHALVDRPRPALASFAGHTIVASDPVDVVRGPAVWGALDVPSVGPSAGAAAMAGGWIGLLTYELAGTLERLPEPHPDTAPAVASIARYPTIAAIDPVGRCTLASTEGVNALDRLEDALRRATHPKGPGDVHTAEPEPSLSSTQYLAAVDRIRALIRDGDCYQVNLTKRLRTTWTHGPLALAARMWSTAGAASHRALVGLDGGTVVSASPERLVVVRDGVATAEPIKGTAPPGEWATLAASVKDRAEHVMIVDLLRNDLGRVAVAGGVSVPRLFAHLATPYLEHMVSEIRAQLRPDATAADVLRAVFPSGSVTGTPKVRAMEIIHELEPVPRGAAFGSVVAVGTDGAVESSVTIRTAWLAGTDLRYWCGGAIVWDSEPSAELAEADAKAAPFLRAIGTA